MAVRVAGTTFALALLMLSGCAATDSETDASSSQSDDLASGNNPLITVVDPKANAPKPIHLLLAPATSLDPVVGTEPVRSLFDEQTSVLGQDTLVWTFEVTEPMILDGTMNWTVWVDVPDGLYGSPTAGCPWDFSLRVQSNSSSSTIGTFVQNCQTDVGPAVPGVRRLDADATSDFLAGERLAPGDTVSLELGCLLLNPNGTPAAALGGAVGRDSQIVLGVRKPPS
ncbi:MAG: hypothetical protein AABX89_04300 [Candidatus Thermoplasmatota archaeon]